MVTSLLSLVYGSNHWTDHRPENKKIVGVFIAASVTASKMWQCDPRCKETPLCLVLWNYFFKAWSVIIPHKNPKESLLFWSSSSVHWRSFAMCVQSVVRVAPKKKKKKCEWYIYILTSANKLLFLIHYRATPPVFFVFFSPWRTYDFCCLVPHMFRSRATNSVEELSSGVEIGSRFRCSIWMTIWNSLWRQGTMQLGNLITISLVTAGAFTPSEHL